MSKSVGMLIATEVIVEMTPRPGLSKEEAETRLRELGHNIISYNEQTGAFKVLQRLERVQP